MIQTTRPEEGAPSRSSAVSESAGPDGTRSDGILKSWILPGSSFVFAVLQSLCTAVIALSGVRVLIGVSALASAAVGIHLAARLHVDRIRIPMMLLALVGALINLYVIRRIRRLRNRPASQWRRQPVSSAKLRSERLQILLAAATLVLLVVEEVGHLYLHHVA
jgi:hypothetical protein